MSFLPDWLLVCATGLACCALILGRWRTAALLAAPAAIRFLAWPLALDYMRTVPPLVLLTAGLVLLPFLAVRALHRMLRLASSKEAADQAMGEFLGRGLSSIFGRRRRRRHRGR